MHTDTFVQILTFAAKAVRPYRKDQKAANAAKKSFWMLLTQDEQDMLQDAWDAIILRRGNEEAFRRIIVEICLRIFSEASSQPQS